MEDASLDYIETILDDNVSMIIALIIQTNISNNEIS